MKFQKVGTRGVLINNDRSEYCYLLSGRSHLILCDTMSLGKSGIEEIESYVKRHKLNRPNRFIFNTHADYDHMWGNAYFKQDGIISSEAAYDEMLKKSEYEAWAFAHLMNESITLKYPTITFRDCLKFNDDGIEFRFLPGHTSGCSILIDHLDGVIFVGDLIEDPLVYLQDYRLDRYLESLEILRDLSGNSGYLLINGHNGIVPHTLIDKTAAYVEAVLNDEPIELKKHTRWLHEQNKKEILLNRYEQLLSPSDGSDYLAYRKNLWRSISLRFNLGKTEPFDLKAVPYKDMKLFLNDYFEHKLDAKTYLKE